MTTTSSHTDLFGGAITANIPSNFTDVRRQHRSGLTLPEALPLMGPKERRELFCSPCNTRTTIILRLVPLLPASADRSSSDSQIRQVPDNQEVYLDKNGFTSLTFDITERVSHLSSDREALEYHFTDIVAEDDNKNICSIVENVDLPNFSPNTPILALTAITNPPASNVAAKALTPTHTDIRFTLIRLEEQKTDIVITLNTPFLAGETDGQRPNGTETGISQRETEQEVAAMYLQIVTSFAIKDWGLFSGG